MARITARRRCACPAPVVKSGTCHGHEPLVIGLEADDQGNDDQVGACESSAAALSSTRGEMR
jgi:hypothetical protein